MKVTAQQIIDVMKSWIGLSRAKGTHKPIIDLYNSHYPLARGYKVSYTDDYCDTTVSAAFIKLSAVDLIGGTECGVEEHINLFKKKVYGMKMELLHRSQETLSAITGMMAHSLMMDGRITSV